VARDESAVIIEKTDGWFSVVDTKSNVLGTADSLNALIAAGNWRKPVKGDTDKFVGLTASLNTDTSPNRAVRVPNHVKEKIREAIKIEPNKRNIPFLLQFTSKETVTVNDVSRLMGIMNEAKRHAQAFTTEETVEWVDKVVNPEPLVAASSFESSDDLDYFVTSDREGTTEVNDLYALNEEFNVLRWTGTEFEMAEEDAENFEAPTIIEIDEDTAEVVADWIEQGRPGDYIDVSQIDEEEFALVSAAMAELDLEEIGRLTSIVADATGYSPVERSNNATRQVRGGDGRFAGEQVPQGDTLTSFNKARLPQEREVILDPAKRVEEYAAAVKAEQKNTEAAVEDEDAPAPLYIAIVDDIDRTAVLDMVAIQVDGDDTKAFVRREGQWEEDPSILEDLRSVTPPAVVELDDEALIKEILAQVDASDDDNIRSDETPDAQDPQEAVQASAAEFKDFSEEKRQELAKKGWALPDGSFPIESVQDLRNAVQAYGRAKEENKAKVRAHIRKRARALNRPDLVPESWKETAVSDLVAELDEQSPLYDPFGVITAAGIPGIADTPSDWAAVNRLKRYWKYGKGGAKIRWAQHDGNLTRCHRHLAKYLGSDDAWGYCQNLHKDIFGFPNPESGGR